jgi:hypothetical protein
MFWFVTEKKTSLGDKFWSAPGRSTKTFYVLVNPKVIYQTFFSSLFLQCHWSCLYYKFSSLFSQSLYNGNRQQAASHCRAATAAAMLLLPLLRFRRASQSAAAATKVALLPSC